MKIVARMEEIEGKIGKMPFHKNRKEVQHKKKAIFTEENSADKQNDFSASHGLNQQERVKKNQISHIANGTNTTDAERQLNLEVRSPEKRPQISRDKGSASDHRKMDMSLNNSNATVLPESLHQEDEELESVMTEVTEEDLESDDEEYNYNFKEQNNVHPLCTDKHDLVANIPEPIHPMDENKNASSTEYLGMSKSSQKPREDQSEQSSMNEEKPSTSKPDDSQDTNAVYKRRENLGSKTSGLFNSLTIPRQRVKKPPERFDPVAEATRPQWNSRGNQVQETKQEGNRRNQAKPRWNLAMKSKQAITNALNQSRSIRRKAPIKRYNPDEEAAKPQMLSKSNDYQILDQNSNRHGLEFKRKSKKRKRKDGFVENDGTIHLVPGMSVKALWSAGKRVYNAIIIGCNGDGTYKLLYSDGGRWEEVPTSKIIKVEFPKFEMLRGSNVCRNSNNASPLKPEVHIDSRIKPEKNSLDSIEFNHVTKSDAKKPKHELKYKKRRQTPVRRVDHKYRGLTWSEQKKRWIARIYHKNNTIHIGTFDDPLQAAKAYDKAARGFGKKLNFPDSQSMDASPKQHKDAGAETHSAVNKQNNKRLTEVADTKNEKLQKQRLTKKKTPIDQAPSSGLQTKKETYKEVYQKQEATVKLGFTGRKRRKRTIYDPIQEAGKPQWLTKEKIGQAFTKSGMKL